MFASLRPPRTAVFFYLIQIRARSIFKMMKKIFIISALFCLAMASSVAAASLNSLLNDVKIVCFYENDNEIDWPLIYYLAAEQGCRIDLANISLGPAFKYDITEDAQYDIGLSRCLIPDTSAAMIDSAFRMIVGFRAPDVVVMPGGKTGEVLQAIGKYIKANADVPGTISKVKAMYYRTEDKSQAMIFANAAFYVERAGERIEQMAVRLTGDNFDRSRYEGYTMYRPDDSLRIGGAASRKFVSDETSYKLADAVNACVNNSALRSVITGYAEKYEAALAEAAARNDEHRIEYMIAALGQLKNVKVDYRPTGGGAECEHFPEYIDGLIDKAVSAILHETGFRFDGGADMMSTAEGDILKISTTCTNGGSLSYKVGHIKLTTKSGLYETTLDTSSFAIPPYRTVKRDYTATLPSEYYSSSRSDMLYIEGELIFNDQYMTFKRDLIEMSENPIKLSFVPSFRLVRPFEGEWVDRLVEMTQLKLLIEKPESFTADAVLEFVTPPGVYVGTYQEKVALKDGDRSYEINLPVAIGKSAGNRKHKIIATLKEGDRTLGWDQAHILGQECKVNENSRIALIGGPEGRLEDILRMTGAGYQTISDRFLETGYLGAYDILLMDTDCFEKYPSLKKLSDKLNRYMEFGGTVIVFGQSEKWPDGSLPVSILPVENNLDSRDARLTGSAKDPLFNNTYKTNPTYLISAVKEAYRSNPARVFPGETIISAGANMSLLSRTDIGSGHLIYCGFPVLDMFADLEPIGVEFLANLINFSHK